MLATSWSKALCLALLTPLDALLLPPGRPRATVQRPARQRIRACAPGPEADGEAEAGGEEATVYEGEEATVYKRKKGGYRAYKPQDNRDQLLYRLTEVTPPPRFLGQVSLAPTLACGDLVELTSDGNRDAYVVKRVAYQYQYSSGRYQMVGKGASVVKTSRDGIEKALGRLLRRPEEDASAEDDRTR